MYYVNVYTTLNPTEILVILNQDFIRIFTSLITDAKILVEHFKEFHVWRVLNYIVAVKELHILSQTNC